jgi:antitoxin ParD1/3/4
MRASLSGHPVSAHYPVMDETTLSPELERFVAEAVAAGRYRDRTALVTAGVRLLQRQEQARAELLASVLAAQEEADRDGYLTGEEVLAFVRARLVEKHGASS